MSTRNLFVLIILLVVAVGAFLYFKGGSLINLEKSGNKEYVKDGVTYQGYWNADIGLGFSYKKDPNGYTLLDKDILTVAFPGIEKYMTLINGEDYHTLLHDKGSHDGPPFIHFMIFKNASNLNVADWLKQNGKNVGYVDGKTVTSVESLGGADGLRYKADGLYMQDIVVMSNNYNIYVFSGDYPEESASIRTDFLDLLKTLEFF